MFISNIRVENSQFDAQNVRASADIEYRNESGRETLWFEVPRTERDAITTTGDPWLACSLPLAARLGEDIDVDAAIDAAFFESTRELLEWWRFWFPDFNIVSVNPREIVDDSAFPRRSTTAQFFSGGVDSFFTLLRHTEMKWGPPVDDLLLGWGFDIPLSDRGAFDRVLGVMNRAASCLGRRVVPFSTNFRETRLKELPWGEISHGNAMAAVAQLLCRGYRRILIPSTDGYFEKGPWGSHATTDHMFATAGLRILHDGAAYTRLEKVRLVAKSEAALAALRVCWRDKSDRNCGRCEKCLRTMIALELCDALDRAETFAHTKLNGTVIEKIYCPYEEVGPIDQYYTEMRDEAARCGRTDLARPIAKALRRSRVLRPLLGLSSRLSWNRYLGRAASPVHELLKRNVIY